MDSSHGPGLPPGERNVHRVFGRRVVWSPWWWFTVAGVGLAAVLTFLLPVRYETVNFGTTECGTLVAPGVEDDSPAGVGPTDAGLETACNNLRGVRWHLVLGVLAVSVVPGWLGWRDHRHADVGPTWVAAAVCVGASAFLLIGPQSSGQIYQCGSALLRTSDTLHDYEGEDALDDCTAAWSGRIAWATLLGTVAIPFAMSAARRREDY